MIRMYSLLMGVYDKDTHKSLGDYSLPVVSRDGDLFALVDDAFVPYEPHRVIVSSASIMMPQYMDDECKQPVIEDFPILSVEVLRALSEWVLRRNVKRSLIFIGSCL